MDQTEHRIASVIAAYVPPGVAYEVVPVPLGLTNTTRLVHVDDETWVVRLYNPHTKEAAGIELEAKLCAELAARQLSVEVPTFRLTRSGGTFVELADGTLGAMVRYLPGSPPELSQPEQAQAYGLVAGELAEALRQCSLLELADAGRPFTALDALHPLADAQTAAVFMERPPFALPERQRVFYETQLAVEVAETGWWRGLPRQLVHHDILIFNLLGQEGRITGALDFDFASMDVGMLELAICLNHVLQQSDGSLELTDAFLLGYGRHRRHTEEELGCLARATRLYHLAVLRLYIGEHYAGKPVEPQFRYILGQFETRMQGLATYGEALERLCRDRLGGHASA